MGAVVYDKYGAEPARRSFYPNLSLDPVGSITDVLIKNLRSRNYEVARRDYGTLLTTIKARGLQGKDVRYVSKELSKLIRSAEVENQDELAKVAARYARQLPKPEQERKRNPKDLGSIVA